MIISLFVLVVLALVLVFDNTVLRRTKTTTIQCELVLASVNSVTADIIYTFLQTFPRIILAEINTHTIAGKNTASSRAIPTKTQLKNILLDPFVPYQWGTYKSGMQAGSPYQNRFMVWICRTAWLTARWPALGFAYLCYRLKLAKQISNRLVEPWMWVEQVWTATDVKNEISLRNHWMAEPHYHALEAQKAEIVSFIQFLAEQPFDVHAAADLRSQSKLVLVLTDEQKMMLDAFQYLVPGQWHLPFVGRWQDINDGRRTLYGVSLTTQEWKQVSAGRCAWVSYYMPGATHKKMNDYGAAISTFKKLAESDPKHLSPLMHQATPLPESVRCGNLCGFLQFRKEIEGESGGDKVVKSVTPDVARSMVSVYLGRCSAHGDDFPKAFPPNSMEGYDEVPVKTSPADVHTINAVIREHAKRVPTMLDSIEGTVAAMIGPVEVTGATHRPTGPLGPIPPVNPELDRLLKEANRKE